MTKTAKDILEQVYLFGMNGGLGYEKFDNELSPDQALKELGAIHQQEIAKARLNEAQILYEDAINSTSHGHITYARKRVERHLETLEEHKAERR